MLMSLEDLSRESRISKHTWRGWLRRKRISHLRLGRRVLVAREDFEAFLRASRVEAADGTIPTPPLAPSPQVGARQGCVGEAGAASPGGVRPV
jgi:excisionase family DNA binding protein